MQIRGILFREMKLAVHQHSVLLKLFSTGTKRIVPRGPGARPETIEHEDGTGGLGLGRHVLETHGPTEMVQTPANIAAMGQEPVEHRESRNDTIDFLARGLKVIGTPTSTQFNLHKVLEDLEGGIEENCIRIAVVTLGAVGMPDGHLVRGTDPTVMDIGTETLEGVVVVDHNKDSLNQIRYFLYVVRDFRFFFGVVVLLRLGRRRPRRSFLCV